jgi:hypothetical protein
MERKQKEEKLEMKKKQFKEEAKLKLKKNAKEIERAKNQFLFENQIKQDQTKELVEWLEEKNWEAEEKEKFFYEKFTQKPLEWLKKNDKAEYMKAVQANDEIQRRQQEKNEVKRSEGEYQRIVDKLKKECNKNLEVW